MCIQIANAERLALEAVARVLEPPPADGTDAVEVDDTAKPAGAAETAVAAAWDSVVQEINSKMPAGARR